ncbi:MAG: pitrilysin family protein, partial [bacterium]
LVKQIEQILTLPENGSGSTFPPIQVPEPCEERFTRSVMGVHICRGVHGLKYDDPKRFAGFVLANVVGGGMSSRLFQRVREQEALAYNIYSFIDTLRHAGTFGAYLGTDPDRFEHALQVLDEEYDKIRKEGIAPDELTRAKEQLKGNLMLSQEGTSGRMFRLAKMEIYLGRFITLDETLTLIDTVTEQEVMALAEEFLNPQRQYTAIILPQDN